MDYCIQCFSAIKVENISNHYFLLMIAGKIFLLHCLIRHLRRFSIYRTMKVMAAIESHAVSKQARELQ